MNELSIFIGGAFFGVAVFIGGMWFKDDFFK
jgi:hypothetical protein